MIVTVTRHALVFGRQLHIVAIPASQYVIVAFQDVESVSVKVGFHHFVEFFHQVVVVILDIDAAEI